jgi:hypothetical protein
LEQKPQIKRARIMQQWARGVNFLLGISHPAQLTD